MYSTVAQVQAVYSEVLKAKGARFVACHPWGPAPALSSSRNGSRLSSSPGDGGEMLCAERSCSASAPSDVSKLTCDSCVCLLLQGGCVRVEEEVQVSGTGAVEA